MKNLCSLAVLLTVSPLAVVPLLGGEIPERILLRPAGEGGVVETIRITEGGDRVVSGVHDPFLFPYVPARESATGAAVIIAPGGGHRELWTTHEGHTLAAWLSERGVAAFVLHYRLAREKDSKYTVDDHALADTRRAIQLVRSRAPEWRLDPARVGVMGFSAGGELAALADMRPVPGNPAANDPVERMGSKPGFVGLIYPGSSRRFEVATNAAPAFIACGYNDRPDISEGMAELYLKYKKARVPAELHIFAGAGHGFGVRETQKGPVAQWPQRFLDWLGDAGQLRRPD